MVPWNVLENNLYPPPPAFNLFQTYGFYSNIKMIYNTFQYLEIITFRIKVYCFGLSNYNYAHTHTHTVITSKGYLVKWSTLRLFFFFLEIGCLAKLKVAPQISNWSCQMFKKIFLSSLASILFYWSEKSECEMVDLFPFV